MWAWRGMRPQGWSNECAREGGMIMSIITDVNGVAAKTTTRMVTIGQDASLITSSARSRAWLCNDDGGVDFVMTQTEGGGGGAEECRQQM